MLAAYVILILILIVILIKIYIKIRCPFWSIQPVFQVYNIAYWLSPPKIIQKDIPPINKYYDFTIQFSNQLEQKKDFYKLISKQYLRKNNVQYSPPKEGVFPYFEKHNKKCFFSLQYKFNKLIGAMTTRPLEAILHGEKYSIYYVDFLCIHSKHRKQGNAPKIIYTHYVQSRKQTDNTIFLFKREDKVNKIVPLTTFSTYLFSLKYWKKIQLEHTLLKNHRIVQDNIQLLYHYLETIKHLFPCFIMPCLSNLCHLIENQLLYVFLLMYRNKPFACYFFRNNYTSYEGKSSIEFTTSVCSDTSKESFFIQYFFDSLYKINPHNLIIENVAHNGIILKQILHKRTPVGRSMSAYFFYNFGYRPFLGKEVFLLN